MARILIIDDCPVIRNLLSDFLADDGHEVKATGDPNEGIALALDQDWTLCICDTHMPAKDGYQVYLKVAAEKPGLPFLITDSLPDVFADTTVRVEGDYYYLKKPFELEQIRDILKSCQCPIKTP